MTREELKVKMEQTVSPRELAREKFKTYKQYIIDRLDEVKEIIEDEDFEKLRPYLSYSPSGDGYGCDNNYIDFSFNDNSDICDIAQAVDYCRYLEDIAYGKIDPDDSFGFWSADRLSNSNK